MAQHSSVWLVEPNADAPAVEVSRDAGPDRAGPPFAFALPYDPARIDPAALAGGLPPKR